ncbi:MAG TPA: hypothetical protein VKB79_15290 [Bryobacteraceae bacterium]|nr:hypothetical protein [Bryobacteraceae bacterium]
MKSPHAATSPPPTAKKRWSKWMKFSGGALLLLGFGIQTQQNTQTALLLERTQAAELDSRTLQKAIGYEGLYFSAKAANLDEPAYLKLAARQHFVGSTAMMVTSPGDKKEIGRKLGQLREAADAVHDLGSFRQFVAVDNGLELEGHQIEMAGLIEPDVNAKFFGRLYLILYGFGSVIALIGQALGD